MRFLKNQNVTLPFWLACASLLLALVGGAFLFSVFGNFGINVRASALLAEQQSQAADMAGIEELHRKDVAATLALDPKLLADLWTEDAVRLEPGGPAEVGLAAIHANDVKDITGHPGSKMLSYQPDIKDVQIVGDCAYEWDNFDASYKETADSKVETFHAKALRVLRKQPDGSWKFARVMWNLNG
jgi:ketosteroid isomerase-like protein